MKISKLNNFKRNCVIRIDDEDEYLISFNGGVFKLNQIGYEIIMEIENKLNKQEIINKLSLKYNVSLKEVSEDVDCFLNELIKLDLI